MNYSPFIRPAALALALIVSSPSLPASPAAGGAAESDYYRYRQAGNYAGAIESLRQWTAGTTDPAVVSANLYRLTELLSIPELRGRGMRALDAIRETTADPFARDHIDRIMAACHRAAGDLRKAETLAGDLSYLDVLASGPHRGGSGTAFEASLPPGEQSAPAPGRAWFPAAPDRAGILDFSDLFPGSRDAHFYLRRGIEISTPGEYYLILGTTGFIDLWLDGVKIFSERAGHAFGHDQHFIRVSLPRGGHRLLAKAGGADEGIRCSLRVAAVDGTRLPPGVPSDDGVGAPGALIAAGRFPALAGLLPGNDRGPDAAYLAGYLLHAAGLRGGGHLAAVPEGHPRRSSARWYMAMEENDPVEKDCCLAQSLRADPKNAEALRELALVKIGRDFIYEAFPLIEQLKRAASARHWHDELMARLFLHTGPPEEARRHIAALESSPVPSTGYRLGASLFLASEDYFHARQELERLVRLDHDDRESCRLLLDCHEKCGDLESAEGLLTRLRHLSPNSTALALRLARVIGARRGPGASLPCLSAALKSAPGDREVLRALGLAYHKMGNRRLALYYLGLALEADPGDRALGSYLEFIRSSAAPAPRPARPQ